MYKMMEKESVVRIPPNRLGREGAYTYTQKLNTTAAIIGREVCYLC